MNPFLQARSLQSSEPQVLRTLTGVNSRDTGYSYANLLRFAPITFPTGGEYTLCFCDAKASASEIFVLLFH